MSVFLSLPLGSLLNVYFEPLRSFVILCCLALWSLPRKDRTCLGPVAGGKSSGVSTPTRLSWRRPETAMRAGCLTRMCLRVVYGNVQPVAIDGLMCARRRLHVCV